MGMGSRAQAAAASLRHTCCLVFWLQRPLSRISVLFGSVGSSRLAWSGVDMVKCRPMAAPVRTALLLAYPCSLC